MDYDELSRSTDVKLRFGVTIPLSVPRTVHVSKHYVIFCIYPEKDSHARDQSVVDAMNFRGRIRI